MLKQLMISAAIGALMVSGAMAQADTPKADAPADAPKADAKPADTAKFVSSQSTDQWVFSKFKGTDVLGPDNAQVGDVNDMVVDLSSGKVQYVVVELERGWGDPDRLTLLPVRAFKANARDDEDLVLRLDQQQVATLRNTICKSFDLLGHEQNGERLQSLFRRLSVFCRGWTIEAALMVCGEPSETSKDIQELMKALRRASLIEVDEVAGEKRFRYLDSIREFAFAELAKEGRDKELASRHARWASEFAERWQPRLPPAGRRG